MSAFAPPPTSYYANMDNANAATTRTPTELKIYRRETHRTPAAISNTLCALSSSSEEEEASSTSISKENEDETKKKLDQDDTDAVLLASGTELTKQMMMKNKNKDDEQNDNTNPLLQIGNALKPVNDLVNLILGSPYSAPFLFLLPILGNPKVRYAIAAAFGLHDDN